MRRRVRFHQTCDCVTDTNRKKCKVPLFLTLWYWYGKVKIENSQVYVKNCRSFLGWWWLLLHVKMKTSRKKWKIPKFDATLRDRVSHETTTHGRWPRPSRFSQAPPHLLLFGCCWRSPLLSCFYFNLVRPIVPICIFSLAEHLSQW